MEGSKCSGKITRSGMMVWIRGGMSAWESEVESGNVWFSCNTRDGEVRVLRPRAFITRMTDPARDLFLHSTSLVILRDFESLRGGLARQWLVALQRLHGFAGTAGVRIVLLSEGPITAEILGIYRFSPLVFGVFSQDPDPVDADLKVHRILECASRITSVSIKRISEKAANFLEYSACSHENEGLLELVIEGIRRSDGHTLRFRDLLPNFAPYFDPDEPLETYCN